MGGVFLSEGVQQFLFPDALGAGWFVKIGIPAPAFTAPFVGAVEIGFGLLLIVGLLIRLAAIPLIIDMLVAVTTTKVPLLLKSGFWAMAHEARTDYAMLLGLIFLLLVGGGAARSKRTRDLGAQRAPNWGEWGVATSVHPSCDYLSRVTLWVHSRRNERERIDPFVSFGHPAIDGFWC